MLLKTDIQDYLEKHSKPLSKHLLEIQKCAEEECEGAHMICGGQVKNLLSILIKLMNAKHILDIGTYVGFSAIAMVEAIGEDGKIISCERDPRYVTMAQEHFDKHPQGHKIELFFGNAQECIDSIDKPIDLSFLDADKAPYIDYYQSLVEKTRPGGLIVADDTLWKGMVTTPNTPRLHLMNEFNEYVSQDSRVESLLIPIRHGVRLIYKL